MTQNFKPTSDKSSFFSDPILSDQKPILSKQRLNFYSLLTSQRAMNLYLTLKWKFEL